MKENSCPWSLSRPKYFYLLSGETETMTHDSYFLLPASHIFSRPNNRKQNKRSAIVGAREDRDGWPLGAKTFTKQEPSVVSLHLLWACLLFVGPGRWEERDDRRMDSWNVFGAAMSLLSFGEIGEKIAKTRHGGHPNSPSLPQAHIINLCLGWFANLFFGTQTIIWA